ncbi:guanylate kinase [Candidatus Liberibacter solanacearum]|uniref:Guanylate kinase n=1 Tax=Candidatus Liberibacter solanacearum TaxID=556287 RepID=A0A3R7NIS6_9HYPH|nr:guanylate kinase [Candidatus Liberibacter solanacearum]RPD36981.1 guanylate kinase [Candidatus Liberibacter solanacearum]
MNRDHLSPMTVDHRGMMLIISSPSGVGKSTIARHILKSDHNFEMSISVTTRSRRPDEVDGEDYHFLTLNKFEELQKAHAFIEWAEVHGNFYGTLRDPIERAISQGKDMLFDIDWQGAHHLRKHMKSDIVSFFILPPTMHELRSRLIMRATKNQEEKEMVQLRLKNAYLEIKQWNYYDYVIVNDDLEDSLGMIKSVISVERMRRNRLINSISGFVGRLLEEEVMY